MDVNMVIFDLDGTLIDTIGDLSAAVENALSRGGFPGHTVDEYRNMVGHGIRNLVTRALPEGSPEEVIDITLERFVEYYTAHIDVLSRPYPGIPELLKKLSSDGFSLAVASNKFQAGTETLIRRFFPEIPFVKILGNSKGLYGMGGYDLYVSQWNSETGDWDVPVNMGFPYSSPYDDFLFINTEDGKYSIFASNRGCDSLLNLKPRSADISAPAFLAFWADAMSNSLI